jgi:hypothetical protein
MISNWGISLSLSVVLAVACCFSATAESDDVHTQRFREEFISHGNTSPIHESVLEYSEGAGLSLSNTLDKVEAMVSSTLEKKVLDIADRLIVRNACRVLGEIGEARSGAVLRKAALSSSFRNMRLQAISSYLKLAREDCLPLAEEVVTKKDVFTSLERYLLYEELVPYAKRSENQSLDKKRDKVRKFLVKASGKESYGVNATKLDEVLLLVLPSSYKSSVQRHKLAMRFKGGSGPSSSKYFAGVVDEIEKVPVEDRKDISR